jgi:hypothetical protein
MQTCHGQNPVRFRFKAMLTTRFRLHACSSAIIIDYGNQAFSIL